MKARPGTQSGVGRGLVTHGEAETLEVRATVNGTKSEAEPGAIFACIP